jgi:hypothetical protein
MVASIGVGNPYQQAISVWGAGNNATTGSIWTNNSATNTAGGTNTAMGATAGSVLPQDLMGALGGANSATTGSGASASNGLPPGFMGTLGGTANDVLSPMFGAPVGALGDNSGIGINAGAMAAQQKKMLNNDFVDFTSKSIGNMDGLGLFNGGPEGVSNGIYLGAGGTVIPAGMDSASANLLAYAGLAIDTFTKNPINTEKYTQNQAIKLLQQAVASGRISNDIAKLLLVQVNGTSDQRAVAGDLLTRMLQTNGTISNPSITNPSINTPTTVG